MRKVIPMLALVSTVATVGACKAGERAPKPAEEAGDARQDAASADPAVADPGVAEEATDQKIDEGLWLGVQRPAYAPVEPYRKIWRPDRTTTLDNAKDDWIGVVALLRRNAGSVELECSGLVVAPGWVLTARHCFDPVREPMVPFPDHDPERWCPSTAIFGVTSRNKINEPAPIEDCHADEACAPLTMRRVGGRDCPSIRLHPDPRLDVVLVRIDASDEFHASLGGEALYGVKVGWIRPQFRCRELPATDAYAKIIGYGPQDTSSSSIGNRAVGHVEIGGPCRNEECYEGSTVRTLAASDPWTTQPQDGDSGGPLMGPNLDVVWGVISHAPPAQRGLGRGFAVAASAFGDWMVDVLRDDLEGQVVCEHDRP